MRSLLEWLLTGGLLVLLVLAVLALPADPAGLTATASANIADSGVENPVTAVLLNFRSYDTLLEIAVLLLALLGAWSVSPSFPQRSPEANASLDSLVRLLVPAMVIAAGYILWVGAYAPGGAFQAGAVLAAALVLAHLGGIVHAQWLAGRRVLLVIGLLVFTGVAVAAVVLGGKLLQYPEGQDKTFILVIEAAATVSIALTLAALFTGPPPAPRDGPPL